MHIFLFIVLVSATKCFYMSVHTRKNPNSLNHSHFIFLGLSVFPTLVCISFYSNFQQRHQRVHSLPYVCFT